MTEMVERVARAIATAAARDLVEKKDVEQLVSDLVAEFEPHARAAIAAIREPTEEMKLAGARSIGATMNLENHTERAAKCWRAMNDIISEEK